MTLIDLAIGLPTMLACLMLQVSVTFWVVKYYLRLSARRLSNSGFLAGARPLMVVMLVMKHQMKNLLFGVALDVDLHLTQL